MSELSGIEESVKELVEEAITGFAIWHSKNWQLGDEKQWKKDFADNYPGDEYIKGYNAGVESAESSVKFYLEEHHYY